MKPEEIIKRKRKTCPPAHAIMEIKDISDIRSSTGETKLTDEAVEKGKEWTEFTKL